MERNALIDKLKGYACFLVLFGHVIMGIRLAGVDIPRFFWGLERFIWSFHVALFMFLSGVVYKMTGEWKGKKTRTAFILHKFWSLGIPYIVFSIVYILINSLVGEANTQSSAWDIFTIWKMPVAQYWFLYALFFLFVAWALLSKILKNWQITAVMVAFGYIAPLFGVTLGGLDAVFYSALTFGVGTFVSFLWLLKPPAVVKCMVVLGHIAAGVVFVLTDLIEAPWVKEFMMFFGIYSSIVLISMIHQWKPVSKFLEFMNKYSFQIYLLHTIFTAGIRIVMIKLGVTQWWIHIVVGTIFGIACSVVAAEIAKKMKPLDFFFFPTKYIKKKKIEAGR